MSKIVCLGPSSYKDWLGKELLTKLEDKGLVIFTGGPDVPPMLYKEPNMYAMCDYNRAEREVDSYYEALKNNIPKLGICYGSQFLTAIQPNGKVVQDVNGHATGRTHYITNKEGDAIEVTSTHHQMMFPWNVKSFELIAWSRERLSNRYLGGFGNYTTDTIPYEPEIVYYPDTNCLCIQGHPEFANSPLEFTEYCRNLVKKYLL